VHEPHTVIILSSYDQLHTHTHTHVEHLQIF